MEIERLNGLLIRQAAVIEKIQDERDRLRALLLHVANNGEFDEGACKDWRGWIKSKMEGGNDLGAG